MMTRRTPDPITLLSAVREMIDASGPDAVLARALGVAKETMQVQAAFWMDVAGSRAEMRAVIGLGRPELMLGTAVDTADGIAGIAIRDRKPYFAEDYLNHPAAVPHLSGFVRDEGISGLLVVPVFREDQAISLLYLLTREKHTFSADDERFLLVLSDLAALIESQHTRVEHLLAHLSRSNDDAELRQRESTALIALASTSATGAPLDAALSHAAKSLQTEITVLSHDVEIQAEPPSATLVPGSHNSYLRFEDGASLSEAGKSMLVAVAGLALARQRAVTETRILLEGKFINELLYGGPNLADVTSRIQAAGIDAVTPRHVVAIGGEVALEQRWLDRFVSALHRAAPGAVAAVHEGRVVVLWPAVTPSVGDSISTRVAKLLAAERSDLRTAGIGGVAALSDPSLPVAVREALFAQRISHYRMTYSTSRVFDIVNAGMYRIFAQVADVDGLRESVRQSVGDLFELDRKKGSDLALTLRVYLEHDRRVSETAKAMHLHPNSLRYRVDRISKVLGIDFSDPDTRFFTLMALRLATDLSGLAVFPKAQEG